MNDISQKSLRRRNFKQLQLNAAAVAPPRLDDLTLTPNLARGGDSSSDSRSQQAVEVPLRPPATAVNLRRIAQEDLELICELGYGNGGVVSKVVHKPSGLPMARKLIYMENSGEIRKQILNEMKTLTLCDSDFIVKYYGQYDEQNQVIVCMEYMDCGSLDKIYQSQGPLSEEVLLYVNAAVVDGLQYLKRLNITHRDIKPSNILVNHSGDIKLCDFGVSGVLINSIAQTFVGTSMYMSPERIMGDNYTDAGDVWSLGLTLVELAHGKFPIESEEDGGKKTPIFELLQRIVSDPAPELPSHASPVFKKYVNDCLQKDKEQRLAVRQLNETEFYALARSRTVQVNGPRPNAVRRWAAHLPNSSISP